MLLREATSETYGPRVYSHHINLHHFIICFVFNLPFTFHFASSVPVSDAILTLVALNPFLTLIQTSSNYLSAWNLLLYLRTLLSMYFKYVQLERYSYAHSWVNPRLFPHKHFVIAELPLIDSLVH